jgi:hypothetical protein
MPRKGRPQNAVGEFLAQRSLTWGDPPAGYEEPPLEFRELSPEEIEDLDDVERLVWEAYGRKFPVNEVEPCLPPSERRARR